MRLDCLSYLVLQFLTNTLALSSSHSRRSWLDWGRSVPTDAPLSRPHPIVAVSQQGRQLADTAERRTILSGRVVETKQSDSVQPIGIPSYSPPQYNEASYSGSLERVLTPPNTADQLSIIRHTVPTSPPSLMYQYGQARAIPRYHGMDLATALQYGMLAQRTAGLRRAQAKVEKSTRNETEEVETATVLTKSPGSLSTSIALIAVSIGSLFALLFTSYFCFYNKNTDNASVEGHLFRPAQHPQVDFVGPLTSTSLRPPPLPTFSPFGRQITQPQYFYSNKY